MNILFVSAYFPPEIGAPAVRVQELSRRWVKMGHRVRVLTGFPNHPTGVVPPSYRGKLLRGLYREKVDGVEVIRCWLIPTPNRRSWQRILNYSSFAFSAGLIGPWLSKPDCVVATSPHLLTGAVGGWLGALFRVPFCLEVRDLWPESLVASGVGTGRSLIIRLLERLASFLYQRADQIVVVTEPMAEKLRADWNIPAERISVVEHGVDLERFRPVEHPTDWPPDLATLNGHAVVSCIGTLGMAHGLNTLLEAARQVGLSDPSVQFLLVGEGAEKQPLMEEARRLLLGNVRFLSSCPHDKIPALIQRSSLCVALLKPAAAFGRVMPTKVLEYLACGRPVVLAAGGHARRVLEQSGGGIPVPPGDAQTLANALLKLLGDPVLQAQCGQAGRRYVEGRFDIELQAARYAQLLASRVDRCRARRS